MEKGISTLAVIPIRANPAHRSELVTQLLFGERYLVLEQQGEWLQVRLDYDGYEGWLHEQQHTKQTASEPESTAVVDLSMHNFLLKVGQEESLHILPGSTLPNLREDQFSIGAVDYLFLGMSREPDRADIQDLIAEAAVFYLNAPYLWGGRTPFGIDCSGFTQIVFKYFGIALRRDASQQAEQGQLVERLQEAKVGDLAFFDSGEEGITHVGIILPDDQVIHAFGKVRIDALDERGIFNPEQDKYSHNLRFIRRMF